MPLITHGGTPGAGCFIQDKSDKVYGQLYAEEVYFNIEEDKIGVSQHKSRNKVNKVVRK